MRAILHLLPWQQQQEVCFKVNNSPTMQSTLKDTDMETLNHQNGITQKQPYVKPHSEKDNRQFSLSLKSA